MNKAPTSAGLPSSADGLMETFSILLCAVLEILFGSVSAVARY